jgi:hypothetical protein
MAICRFHKNVTYGRENLPTRQAVKETAVKKHKKNLYYFLINLSVLLKNSEFRVIYNPGRG